MSLRVPMIGGRPDLPEDVSYSIVDWHEDGTVSVDAPQHELRLRVEGAERPEHVKPWKMPTGAHDAPNIGDHRWHDGRVWRSKIVGNTTVPGSDDRWWETTQPPAIPDKLRSPLKALRPQVQAAANITELRTAVLAILDTLTGEG